MNDTMKEADKYNKLFWLIVLAFLVYAGLYIFRTSFVVEGKRIFSLFDDAMVSMRYAKNLVNGHGLVWNPGGEKVEGFTNFLWVIYMAFFHLFPISPLKISLLIQASGAVLLAVNLYFVRKIACFISKGSQFVSLGAVFLTAFYLPINNWTLQGMEVGLLTLIVSVAAWQAIRCLNDKTFSFLLYAVLGISLFVRPDMVVPYLSIMIFIAVYDSENRTKNLAVGLGLLTLIIVAQSSLRMWYYGDFLPNTYYLKVTGYPLFLRITRGLFVFASFAWRMNFILFFLPLIILFPRRDKFLFFLLWILLGQIAYSIYVGGDSWETWGGSNRYLSIAMPGFFILFSYSLLRLSELLFSELTSRSSLSSEKINFKYLFAFLLVLSLVSFNSINHPEGLAQFFLVKRPLHNEDNKTMLELSNIVRTITTPKAKIAVVWAGAIPYFAERYAVDMLGKNDKYIARIKMRTFSGRRRFRAFYPGHLKYDYDYSVGQLQPDVVVQLWRNEEEAEPYLERDYKKVVFSETHSIHIRDGSPHVISQEVRFLTQSRRPQEAPKKKGGYVENHPLELK